MVFKTTAAMIDLGALANFYLQQNPFAITMDAGPVDGNGSSEHFWIGKHSFFLSISA